MTEKRSTPKDRRRQRAKASAKDKLNNKNKGSCKMQKVEKIKKLEDRPTSLILGKTDCKAFEVKTRCVTCPNCGTNWCYEHIREFQTDRYCQYCNYEDKIKGQYNK